MAHFKQTPGNYSERKRRRASYRVVLVTISLLLLLIVPMWAGCSDDSTDDSAAATSTTADKLTLKEKDPVTEEAVTRMVTRKVGEEDYTGDPIIRYITITAEDGGKFVDIGVGRPPSCHPGQVVGYITEMSQGFMSSLFLYPDVTRVRVTLFGTTDDDNDKDIMAAYAVMTKADADAIDDWFAFTENSIGEMATEYWVEPVIFANWQKYGSTTITDPALLEQANQ